MHLGCIAKKALWITWERQRRSVVLSQEFRTAYHEMLSSRWRLLRYVELSIRTLKLLFTVKPAIFFVQNPSMILATIACFYRMLARRTFLVVDRHSNFSSPTKSKLINWLYSNLSRFTIRNSDITIVTNDYLKLHVERLSGRGVVLQDKIPLLTNKKRLYLAGKNNILCLCSFDSDEPHGEIINAARLIDKSAYIYITGHYKRARPSIDFKHLPPNIVFLGLLDEDVLIDYLYSVDIVLALTNMDHTLLCSAYEAVSAGKPIVISNKADLIGYFRKGTVPTNNDAASLANGIREAIKHKESLAVEIRQLKHELLRDWQERFEITLGVIHRTMMQSG